MFGMGFQAGLVSKYDKPMKKVLFLANGNHKQKSIKVVN